MADQVSDLGLKLNYWYLTNRQQLRKWWVLVLVALDVFLLAATLTQGTLLFFRFRDATDAVGNIVATTQAIAKAEANLKPQPLAQGTVFTTPRGQNRYDFSVRLENPNTTWMAVATIQFTGGAKELTPVRVILPPKTTRYALALNVANESAPRAAFTTSDLTWTRLTPAEAAESFDVRVTGLKVGTQTLVTGDNQQRSVTQVTGILENRSFDAFESLRVAVVLTRGNATVGVGNAIISRIDAETNVPFSVEWDTVITGVEKAEAIPEVYRDLIVR